MDTKQRDAKADTKRAFRWQISSATIDFMRDEETRAARDGCGGNDCSMISPLPTPQGKPLEGDEGQE